MNRQGKNEEALEANAKSLKIVQRTDDQGMKELIEKHKQLLIEDNWKVFRQ